MRDLIYFVIGGNSNYVELLAYCIQTMRHFPENLAYDILVLCDAAYAPHVQARLGDIVTHIHVTPRNPTPIHASMRKLDVFDVPCVREGKYDRVLFLDCDIIVTASLAPAFHALERRDVLYVCPERNGAHDHLYWMCLDRPYDPDTLCRFQERGIVPFNAGQFGFRVSEEMRAHFETLRREKEATYNPAFHFYEQSFMNDHFNRAEAVAYDLEGFVMLFAWQHPSKKIIQHFSGAGTKPIEKLRQMKTTFERLTQ